MYVEKLNFLKDFLERKKDVSFYLPEFFLGRPGDNVYKFIKIETSEKSLFIFFSHETRFEIFNDFDLSFGSDFVDVLNIKKIKVYSGRSFAEWTDCEIRIE